MIIKIQRLRETNGEWFWEAVEWVGPGTDTRVKTCWTSKNGEGIFHEARAGQHVQDAGLCQFSLAGMSVSGARRKLKRYYGIGEA